MTYGIEKVPMGISCKRMSTLGRLATLEWRGIHSMYGRHMGHVEPAVVNVDTEHVLISSSSSSVSFE